MGQREAQERSVANLRHVDRVSFYLGGSTRDGSPGAEIKIAWMRVVVNG
jgi:hypothetical protein